MNRYLSLSLLTLLSVIVTKCDRNRLEAFQSEHNLKKVELYVFSAPWCTPCKEELVELQKWHDNSNLKDRVDPTVYVISGNPPTVPANESIANEFVKSLGVTFKARPDRHARFYRTLYSSGTQIPAITIADEAGKALKIYQPGTVLISALENDILEVLK